MELLLLYFWLKLSVIIGVFAFLTTVMGVFGVLGWVWTSTCDSYAGDAERRKVWRPIFFRKIIPAFAVFGIISIAIPDKTETAILVGGHYALKVANTPESAKVMSVLRKKANEILDKELEK